MIVGFCLALLAWIATYAIHSTLWIVAGVLFARRANFAPRVRAVVVLVCVLAPFFTSVATRTTSWGHALAIPGIRIEEEVSVNRTVDGDGNVKEVETGGLSFVSRVVLVSIAGGAAVFVVIAIARSFVVMRSRRKAIRAFGERMPVDSDEWKAAFDSVVTQSGLTDVPRFSSAAGLSSAVALPWEVCIPNAWLHRRDQNEMRVVLSHEVEHIIWRDPFVLAALQFIRQAFPWQPLHALALATYVDAVEEACDAAAVRSIGNARSVARVLLNLAPVEPAALLFTSLNSGRGIRHRIERIVAAPSMKARSVRVSILCGVALFGGLVVLSAAAPYVAPPSRVDAPEVTMRIEVEKARP